MFKSNANSSVKRNTPFLRFVKQLKISSVALILALSISGCMTAFVAGVAIISIDIIHDRRTVGEYIDDGAIELAAKDTIDKGNYKNSVHIKPQSWNGILLLTGEIKSSELKQELIPKLQAIRGVRQLFDETIVSLPSRLKTRANDAWITSKVKSHLLVKTGLDANRIKVVTTRANVYLMGIVTQDEADKAGVVASRVRGVKNVVRVFEYTQIKNADSSNK